MQTCVDYVTEGVTNFVDGVLSVCNSKLQKELQKHNIDHSFFLLMTFSR